MQEKTKPGPRQSGEDMPSFDEVMRRLSGVAGIRSQSDLARALNLTPASVSDAKKRGLFPLAWAVSLARSNGVSLDLMLGFPVGSAPTVARDDVRRLRLEDSPVLGRVLLPNDAVAIDGLIMVPKVAARLSAGGGSFEADAEVRGHYAFRADWLRLKGRPEDMVLMEVSGDSMEPELRDGDTVLINQGQAEILAGKTYAVGIEDTVVVKQVERRPGQLVLRSANPAYAPIIIDMQGDLADTVRIIGRVIWWCHEAR